MANPAGAAHSSSLDDQAIAVANSLHDELHLLVDEIRLEFGNKVAVRSYVALIQECRSILDDLRGKQP